jgi:hypothetical protein
MRPRKDDELKKPFDPSAQDEIFFTMKVYATKKGNDLKTLKYSIDFHPPFESNNSSIAPFASPIVKGNMGVFGKIFKNVQEVFKFISDPLKYPVPENYKVKKPEQWRVKEQENLAKAIRLAEGAINHITYELNSPPAITVGAVFQATGNGDMKPPKA